MCTFVTSECEISFLFFCAWMRNLGARKYVHAGLCLVRALRGFKCFGKISHLSEIISYVIILTPSFSLMIPFSSFVVLLPLLLPRLSFPPNWVKFLAPGFFARKKTTLQRRKPFPAFGAALGPSTPGMESLAAQCYLCSWKGKCPTSYSSLHNMGGFRVS